jgi:crossover junction endodeoxyribonuclease RuvC
MIVLAIDPGYDRVGIALLKRTESGEKLLYSECLLTSRERTFEERLFSIGTTIEKLIEKFNVDTMALERLYFNSNQKTAMRVAEVRGALLFLAQKHTLRICEYTPAEVKVGVTGSGRGDKRAVALMVNRLLKLPPQKRYDDEYDALALGLTCLASIRENPYPRKAPKGN